jgi:hypothetical protein
MMTSLLRPGDDRAYRKILLAETDASIVGGSRDNDQYNQSGKLQGKTPENPEDYFAMLAAGRINGPYGEPDKLYAEGG